MTDNEIMYALCQCSQGEDAECRKCAYADYDYCHHRLFKDALDLIKKQQAEIERLTAEHSTGINELLVIVEDDIRAEAIKEFAQELKDRTSVIGFNASSEDYIDGYCAAINYYDAKIDNLVKEIGCGE